RLVLSRFDHFDVRMVDRARFEIPHASGDQQTLSFAIVLRDVGHVPPAAVQSARAVIHDHHGLRLHPAAEAFDPDINNFTGGSDRPESGYLPYFSETAPIFVTARWVQEKITQGDDLQLSQQAGPLRADAR